MKSITECLKNSLIVERADKSYQDLFGHEICMNETMRSTFSNLGMDFRHIYDRFVIYEDGCLEYTNPQLFTGSICAKIYKNNINRHISANDNTIKVYPLDAFSEMDPPVLDLCSTPKHYMRAIYNALTHKNYKSSLYNYEITSIDYTKNDYEKDKK